MANSNYPCKGKCKMPKQEMKELFKEFDEVVERRGYVSSIDKLLDLVETFDCPTAQFMKKRLRNLRYLLTIKRVSMSFDNILFEGMLEELKEFLEM